MPAIKNKFPGKSVLKLLATSRSLLDIKTQSICHNINFRKNLLQSMDIGCSDSQPRKIKKTIR